MIQKYRKKINSSNETEEESERVANYISQMFSKKSTTEMAIMVEFEAGIQAKVPLTNKDKLC
jgi:capsular polysaccharide biosynthesis protein